MHVHVDHAAHIVQVEFRDQPRYADPIGCLHTVTIPCPRAAAHRQTEGQKKVMCCASVYELTATCTACAKVARSLMDGHVHVPSR
jgi:hypothetical protein